MGLRKRIIGVLGAVALAAAVLATAPMALAHDVTPHRTHTHFSKKHHHKHRWVYRGHTDCSGPIGGHAAVYVVRPHDRVVLGPCHTES